MLWPRYMCLAWQWVLCGLLVLWQLVLVTAVTFDTIWALLVEAKLASMSCQYASNRNMELYTCMHELLVTSLFQTCEMRTPCFAQVQIVFLLTAVHYNPWSTDTLLLCKADRFSFPLIPGLYKMHSIMRVLASFSHNAVRHHWSIQHQDIITASG